MPSPSWSRGQSGLDRLLLFVVAVLALLFVAPHALDLAGVDIQEGGGSGSAVPASDADLTVLAARGEAADGSSVGVVRLVVSPNPGRTPVDLSAGMAVWAGDRSYYLAPAGSGGDGFDGTYDVGAVGGGSPVLDEPTDRGVVRFDLGTDDVGGAEEFGSRLAAGETATVTLVTQRGDAISREIRVPDSPSPGGDVPL